VAVQPEVTLRLTIQSADADSAQSMSRLIDLLAMKATADRIKGHYITPKVFEILESFIKTLRPSVSGDQLVLTLDHGSLLRDCVVPAMQKFRTMARRETSDSVIRQLLAALYLWAAANQGVFPPDLQTLVKTGVTGPQNLINPSRPELGQAGYVYLRPNVPLSKLEDPGGQVVLYEAHERFGEGVNVGFADGHVGWIADQARFQALLSASKSNEATSQPTTAPNQPD
jgi:prepilin-type processing-associated H-X9-DG protein